MATISRPVPVPGGVVRPRKSAGLWSDAFSRLRKNRLAILGLFLVSLLLLTGLLGPVLAPWPYEFQDLPAVFAAGGGPLPPLSPGHLLGTDQLGRDLFSRLLDGARISVSVAFVVQLVILAIGVPIGALAGWFGGRLDNLLMRFTDIIYAFPDLLFIILLSVVFRETAFGRAIDGLLMVFVAIGITSWVTVARLVRGQLLALKETEFVEAARAIGVKDRRIVTRHLLPNGMGPIIVAVTSASASSRLGRHGGASSPRARSTSARRPTSSRSRPSPSPWPSSGSHSSATACATPSIRS
jgi:oligopeptide transport system permease protein